MRRIVTAFILSLLLIACGETPLKEYSLEVVAEYPHDVESYTQGLFFQDGQLYESTGLRGKSTFRKVDLQTGKALERLDFDKKYFVEGSVMWKDNLYILTWDTKTAFIYDANTLEYKIGEIFNEITNKFQSGYILRQVIDIIQTMRFQTSEEKHELSCLYENKIQNMGNSGRNGGEYYTPRPLIRTIIITEVENDG